MQAGDIQLEHTIALSDAKLGAAFLTFTVHMQVFVNGKKIAESIEHIGLREFTYENERFYLNEGIYLRGGFWEGVYANTNPTPNRAMKSAEKSNSHKTLDQPLRPWRRPVPPMIEEADAAGILVIASPAVECMSCWPSITSKLLLVSKTNANLCCVIATMPLSFGGRCQRSHT